MTSPIGPDDTAEIYGDPVAASPIGYTGTPPLTPTGAIGKAFDTFLDALAISGANKIIGTTYPTGQLSPAQVTAQNQAAGVSAPNTTFAAISPALIGAAVLAVVVLVLIRKSD